MYTRSRAINEVTVPINPLHALGLRKKVSDRSELFPPGHSGERAVFDLGSGLIWRAAQICSSSMKAHERHDIREAPS